MTEARNGRIITFYSYKGGTGRTMALSNVAWILAANGHRVLTVDWDLESPGLHKFFRPFLDSDKIVSTPGVIELITEYAWAARRNESRPDDWHRDYARVRQHVVSIDWDDFPGDGSIDFLSAGRQNRDYSSLVARFDWDTFYDSYGGGQFLDAMRDDMSAEYDYVLIDSRTGVSDISDITTEHFPHILVTCFTLSDQSIEGASDVATQVADRFRARGIRILPVPMRVDDAEKEKLDAGRAFARSKFARFPTGMSRDEAITYWGAVEIPYKPFYAYEETLATFGDAPGSPASLLAAYERLADVITDGEVPSLPAMPEELRMSYRDLFRRRRPATFMDVYISYVPEDRLWYDWIKAVLSGVGLRVHPHNPTDQDNEGAPGSGPIDDSARILALLSPAYLRSAQAREIWQSMSGLQLTESRGQLIPVRIADVRLSVPYADPTPLDLVRLEEEQAMAALLRTLDRPGQPTEAGGAVTGPRYPGRQPTVLDLPTRNATFTGRGEVLQRLREQLVGGAQTVVTQTVVTQAALYGLGGVGKTQLAIEYAHRYMADYDVVWWISAEQSELLNGAMANLAVRLGLRVGDNVAEAAQAARDALRRGEPYKRWLLIFDNADNPEELQDYLPGGTSGHVLITSRHRAWEQAAVPLPIDVFTREESLEHLRRRVPSMNDDEAGRVAEALGDLPLAIEQAGAWLQETGMDVDEYVETLNDQPAATLALGETLNYPRPVVLTWNVSFDRLRERSPAAVRLLELLSYFAPEPVSLSMLYGDETVKCLLKYDDTLRDKIMIGRLVRELSRFALAKVDQRDNSVQVHRLVQAVLRDRMTESEQEDTMHDVHRILLGARPREGDTDDPENWRRFDEIWPHLTPSQADDCDEEETRQLLIDRVRYWWKRGEFERALEMGRRLEERWINKLGNVDRQTLFLRFQMANVLRQQGKYQEACDLDRAIMEDQLNVLPKPHPHTLMTAAGLAADLRALGQLQESLQMEQESYDQTRDLFVDDHPRTLTAANNLAVALRHVGQINEARRLDQETLDRRRAVIGIDHPYTLSSQLSLALDIREAGEYQKAAELLRDVLSRYQRVLGSDFVDTLRAARNLAVALRKAGALTEARQLTEATLERYVQHYGPDYPDTVICRLNLAGDLGDAGDWEAARRLAEQVLDTFETTLGPAKPYTLIAANNLLIYQRETGDVASAYSLGTQTLNRFTETLGKEHPFRLVCTINVANCLADLGKYDQAETMERELLTALRDAPGRGPLHPDTLVCEANLAVTLRDLRRADEARELREAVLVHLRRVLGEAHPLINAVLDWRRVSRDLDPLPW
ncbi:tetratricopeptide repeat protein [Nonomuraea fuscirosea]|uniref:Tetratricopeptide repeat protein n=1 Tax=Nonomuraea fuscirosea TaxID=1291556 RepID=A0A2T0N8M5_9ACTN|nr:FxSxx-COOH system tetratricopeptide repeat protein [Nonomuraea fuscirosea]PRX68996.1 tetratricopeptide repeat protein [Nonomuraea fuscirosea]